MNKEELKAAVTEIIPTATFDEAGEFLTALISASEQPKLMRELRFRNELSFDYLFCETCIDWKDHFMMVYFLESKQHKHSLVVKAKISDINKPSIDSVNEFWKTAELNEDEIYDMFGVRFRNHPNLRRLFLDENWPGYPLRKNYTDENMIEL